MIELRKGPDLFVQVAQRLLSDPLAADLAPNTWFVWVGHHFDPHLVHWVLHDARTRGLEDRVLFVGACQDTAPYFMAADLFALTSREDPCPTVILEAMESGLAAVAFRDSGGAAEVLGDAGIAVPYLDVNAMAEAARDLLRDPARRTAMGQGGQTKIRERFTWSRFMGDFLDILEKDYNYQRSQRLKVSVIVPNYCHARFLEDRLSSIFEQTLPPHEIIFLDNASTDESVADGASASRT